MVDKSVNVSKGLKIHIGCGPVNIPGWVNIDARNFSHVHIVTDDINLREFADETVCEIYLCHVLEHFSFIEVEELVKLFYKKLKCGGVIRVSVPDFELIINGYQLCKKNLFPFRKALMGGQDYPFNFHKSIYDFELLSKIFRSAGFKHVTVWDPALVFSDKHNDWSSKKIRVGFKHYPVSLNLCAVKK
jgi:predicted SAM-dependent methyltransferase